MLVALSKIQTFVFSWTPLVFRVTIGHPWVTIGHLRATMGHLRLTIGYLKATVAHIRSP